MNQSNTFSYKGLNFTAELIQREDKHWHGYGYVDLGYETVQIAGLPAPDRTTASRNALLQIRRFINQLTA